MGATSKAPGFSLHPGRLTWNIIMKVWKIIFLSKWMICRFHLNLPGCIEDRERVCQQPPAALFLASFFHLVLVAPKHTWCNLAARSRDHTGLGWTSTAASFPHLLDGRRTVLVPLWGGGTAQHKMKATLKSQFAPENACLMRQGETSNYQTCDRFVGFQMVLFPGVKWSADFSGVQKDVTARVC